MASVLARAGGCVGCSATYGFLLEALDHGEGARVVDILHDEPINSFLVVTVDAGSLDQLQLDLLDGLGVIFGVEVDGERVDHLGSAGGGIQRGEEDGGASEQAVQHASTAKQQEKSWRSRSGGKG